MANIVGDVTGLQKRHHPWNIPHLVKKIKLHHNTDGVALPQISRKIALKYFYYSQTFIPYIQAKNVY